MSSERLLVIVGFVVVLGVLVVAAKAYRNLMAHRANEALRRERAGRWTERPEVFYFYTEDCVPCRAQQWPALEELAERMPDKFTIHRVDALAETSLADRFGILTVPSTVIVDRTGHVYAMNYGFADAGRLESQVQGAWSVA